MSELSELAKALCVAQSQIKGAVKDSANPFFKSKYADLESVWEAIRKPLTDQGLSVVQLMDWREGHPVLVTRLLHTSGQFIESVMPLFMKAQDPQALGSAMTYARRYSLAAIVGVPQIDDDGEAAMNREPRLNFVKPKKLDTRPVDLKIADGKYKGKRVSEIDPEELRAYISEAEFRLLESGKGEPKWFSDLKQAVVV